MKCKKCGYLTDNKRSFINHTRNGCKSNGKAINSIICICGKRFNVIPSRQGRTKYCSKKCANDNYVKGTGFKPNYKNGNRGWFKNGEHSDEKHPNWVGDKVSYTALHSWIHRKLGKAFKCDNCGETKMPTNKKRFFQWANISGEYKRDVSDWKQLCSICHRKFDGITKFSKEEAATIKNRYMNGESQKSLAAEFKVDQGTISNIVNNKIKYYVS